jgi:hypothetical protein
MPTRKINFDLFQLHVDSLDGERVDFEDILLELLDNYTPITQNQSPVIVIDTCKKGNRYVTGTMAHNQMYDLPPVADTVAGVVGELPIQSTQGLAHCTSFIFDKELQIIIYERRQNGVSFNSFCKFYESNYPIKYIEADIIVDPIDMKRLLSMEVIKKISVKVAKIQNGTLFSSTKTPTFKKMRQAADDTNFTTMEYTLKAGRSKSSSLVPKVIQKLVKELFRFTETEEVSVLSVTGKLDEDDQSNTIDFVTNRIKISIEVERARFNQAFSISEKYEAMEAEYQKIRPEVHKIYKIPSA